MITKFWCIIPNHSYILFFTLLPTIYGHIFIIEQHFENNHNKLNERICDYLKEVVLDIFCCFSRGLWYVEVRRINRKKPSLKHVLLTMKTDTFQLI